MTASRWDRAGSLPVPVRGRPRPEMASLPPDDLPTLGQLFTFMRDAELRFETLRMRIEERTATSLGDQTLATDVWLRHPGWARMLTSDPMAAPRASTRSGSPTARRSARTSPRGRSARSAPSAPASEARPTIPTCPVARVCTRP